MAVFYTLAIDCDQNVDAAQAIAGHFDGLRIPNNADLQKSVLVCEAEAWRSRRCWGASGPNDMPDWMMVTVTQPVYHGGPRNDLVSAASLNSIRDHLYIQLRTIGGFRAAQFGEERQDFLGMYDWPDSLERFLSAEKPGRYFEGLIVEESLAAERPIGRHLALFSEGYVWWNMPLRLRIKTGP